ncbi:MAG: acetyl-CoA carboxylase, biotin carboxyl carrier protein [Turicibacter sp.]|nr:acetyl-CoA carboxylase, biotin carboxyl carrier protein [Turicibacter sp.]
MSQKTELIGELGQIMEKHGLTKITLIEKELSSNEIILERGTGKQEVRKTTELTATIEQQPQTEDVQKSPHSEVIAPMVGVFYTAPSANDAPFVKIGDNFQKGDTLCILEAMKLMNEIQADRDGKIIDICVANGDVVEFGQILFKVQFYD